MRRVRSRLPYRSAHERMQSELTVAPRCCTECSYSVALPAGVGLFRGNARLRQSIPITSPKRVVTHLNKSRPILDEYRIERHRFWDALVPRSWLHSLVFCRSAHGIALTFGHVTRAGTATGSPHHFTFETGAGGYWSLFHDMYHWLGSVSTPEYVVIRCIASIARTNSLRIVSEVRIGR